MQVENGECKLLYTPFQLHLPRRKVMQICLLQLEIRTCYATFNSAFTDVRAAKRKATESIEERLNRITDLQRELGNTVLPKHLDEDPLEDFEGSLKVRDDEISASKWIPPEKRCAHTTLKVTKTPMGLHTSLSLPLLLRGTFANTRLMSSEAFSAETLVRSPRKSVIFSFDNIFSG